MDPGNIISYICTKRMVAFNAGGGGGGFKKLTFVKGFKPIFLQWKIHIYLNVSLSHWLKRFKRLGCIQAIQFF